MQIQPTSVRTRVSFLYSEPPTRHANPRMPCMPAPPNAEQRAEQISKAKTQTLGLVTVRLPCLEVLGTAQVFGTYWLGV